MKGWQRRVFVPYLLFGEHVITQSLPETELDDMASCAKEIVSALQVKSTH